MVLLSQPVNMAHPLNRGLVSWWMNLPHGRWGGGLAFRDLIRRNDGDLLNMDGSDWVGAKGRPGGWGALNFAPNHAVQIPNDLSIESLASSPFTITVWIMPITTGEGVTGRIADKRHAPGAWGGWLFFTDDNSSLGFITARSNGSINAHQRGSDNALTLGQWAFVCVTYNDWGDRKGHIYVNGSEIAYDTNIAAGAATGTDQGGALYIGNEAAISRAFDGRIDDVRIYRRLLSITDINALYRESRAGYPSVLNWIRRRVVKEIAAASGLPLRLVGTGGLVGAGGLVGRPGLVA